MFAIGLVIFFASCLLAIDNHARGFKKNYKKEQYYGSGIWVGAIMMFASIVIFLWKVLP